MIPVVPTIPERKKPVTSLPPPRAETIYDVHVYEPHKGKGEGGMEGGREEGEREKKLSF